MRAAESIIRDTQKLEPTSPNLFTPLTIRSITFPNRIAMSPMCEYSSEDGFANDWHLIHLGSRAVGGAGLVIAEATAVEPRGRITYADLGLWKDDHIDYLRRITTFVKSQGAVPGIQLAHAGRKASTHVPWDGGAAIAPGEPNGWEAVVPSPIAFHDGDPAPRALTKTEIAEIVGAFGAAARRALAAGFEVVEIHGAHGYLINEFLSPLSNHRNDEYGGPIDNRLRFLVEIVNAVRAEWPQKFPLFLRVSATDWVEGGWTVSDSVELARRVGPLGVDLIDCSSGGLVPYAKIELGPGYQVPFARQIRRGAAVLTGAVGMITEVEQADAIIRDQDADLVLLAREILRRPYFPMHAAQQLGLPILAPKQYLRAFPESKPRSSLRVHPTIAPGRAIR
jgi:2,4-dienoyl-CoA reductase-like NADH-dependent reductase (Old Yellow Enzyme family)